MVSSLFADALRDPTELLIDLYRSSEIHDDFSSIVSAHFASIFASEDAFNEIPILSVRNGPDAHAPRSLVRFRAMVQDTSPSPDMYLQTLAEGRPGGWGMEIPASEGTTNEVDYSDLRECAAIFAVSVPGETEWCSSEMDGATEHSDRAAGSSSTSHKSPSIGVAHVGAQIKLYDPSLSDSLKTTDMATFVGILTREAYQSSELENAEEVPTLHVLFTRRHPPCLVGRPYADAETRNVRDALIAWIADEALGGDSHAAEWVLLAFIARVQSRNPPLLPPSLTLSHFPPSGATAAPPPAPTLAHILPLLLPLFTHLPLSLDLLNTNPFAPESKQEDLHAGALQIPVGSALLVSEGGVQEGKLVERGVMNIRVLQDVLATQTLGYVFPFSTFAFPTDIAAVILAEGKKSAFFQTDIIVPLVPSTASPDLYKPLSAVRMPPPAMLDAFRRLVVGAKSAGKVRVGQDVSEHIQADFVRDRQQMPGKVTSEDLIQRMTVAKLYTMSLHEPELTVDIWQRAKALDVQRRARTE